MPLPSTPRRRVLSCVILGSLVLTLSASTAAVALDQAPNQPPTVNAGPDRTVTFPAVAALSGVVTDDGLPGSGLTVSWSQVSGPGTATFAPATTASTTANFTAAGTYVLQLTADDGALSSSDTVTVTVNPGTGGNRAIHLNGVRSAVSFGPAPGLGASTFTLELWFRRAAPGLTVTTGTGGVVAVPLVTKGRAVGDNDNTDVNYFLGINASGKLVADFEEGPTGGSPGLNHPVVGSSTIANDIWYHAAATYDGTTWRLYLNGIEDGSLLVGQPPRSDSVDHAGVGTAINASGLASGFFDGDIDEVRIWGVARTAEQIQAGMNLEVASAPNLLGRWGFNEGSGTFAWDSTDQHITGSLNDFYYFWTGGAPFRSNQAPAQPVLTAPLNGATEVPTSPTLDVSVADADGDPLTVSFYGGPVPATAPEFTLAVIPDTQHYVDDPARAATFTAQTQWIAANQISKNIAFVTHLGDIVEHDDDEPIEWSRADSSLSVLEAANMKWGLSPGNHDMSSGGLGNYFDLYFPVSRFEGYPWYGGYLGKDPVNDPVNRQNKNNYELFSVGGLDFIIIHLEYDLPGYSVAWADRILKQHPTRRAIISTHLFLSEKGGRPTYVWDRPDGNSAETVWQQIIRTNCNVFLVLNGHYSGEAHRTDPGECGQPIHQVSSDYQSRINGGDGWLRYMTFKPAENKIYVYTFSPTLNGGAGLFETDDDSQFVLDYNMQGAVFAPVATLNGVAPGSQASATWPNLAAGVQYEWYARVADGIATTTGPAWRFTTSSANRAPVADAQSVTTLQNTATAITLTASDLDEDPLTFTVVSGPTHGALTGTAPNLTYTPASGYTGPDSFTFRANDGHVNSNTATVSITVAPLVTLTVTLAGGGTGVVTSNPAGITCPGTCSASFVPDTNVTLSRNANAGSVFTGWSGACTGIGACVVTMTGAMSVTATFAPEGRDLLVTALTDPPALAAPGTSFSLTDTTRNDGALTTGTSHTQYYLSADGVKDATDVQLTGSRSVAGLAYGVSSTGTVTVIIPSTTPLGTYRVLACADDRAVVVEFNETNNCLASGAAVQVTRPDLVLTAVTNPPAMISPTARFSVTDTVQNSGILAAVASTTRYYLSLDTVIGVGDVLFAETRSVPTLAPSASSTGSKTITVPASTPSGTYYLGACADGPGAIPESIETNNCRASQTTVQVGWPDLATTTMTNPPAIVAAAGKFDVTDTVVNQGDITAAASVTAYYLSTNTVKDASDLLLSGTRNVVSLVAGASNTGLRNVTVPATTPLATYYLIGCADYNVRIPENNEANNCIVSTTTVQVTLPDLVESALDNPPASAAPGGAITVADTVLNQGNIDIGTSTTRYFLSLDAIKDASDVLLTGTRSVPILAAGAQSVGTRSVTIPTTTAPGVYFLLACADDLVKRVELDETNNCRASVTTIAIGQ